MKNFCSFILCVVLVLCASAACAKDYTDKKVLYIDSYHKGYAWSDGITRGVETILKGTGVELKIIRMDTKRNTGEAFKQEAALNAKTEIESFKPDVIITSDDNAAKYLIKPYYKNSVVPFVFCGVNWDAAVYGFPYKNTTGMIEVTPIPQLVDQLKPFAKGSRLGMIAPDILTAKKEEANYRKVFDYNLAVYYAKDFEDWKKGFVELQKKVDILIVDSDGGLYNDKAVEMKSFVEANTKIPTGAAYDFMAPVALFTYAKSAEEQGAWSATAALKILDGTSPLDIAIAKNKEGRLIINTKIASKLGVELPYGLMESADQLLE